VAFLLSFRSEGDDGGTNEAEPEQVRKRRRTGATHLLHEDHLLNERRTAAAVFLGPRDTGPAALIHAPLPLAEEGEAFVHGVFQAAPFPVRRDISSEPGAQVIAELLLFRVEVEVDRKSVV